MTSLSHNELKFEQKMSFVSDKVSMCTASFVLDCSVGLLLAVITCIPVLPVQYAAFVLHVIHRACLYGPNTAFIAQAWVAFPVILNSYFDELMYRNENVSNFLSFLCFEMEQVIEIFPNGWQKSFILNSQNHGYWCPGDARSQVICSQGVEPIVLVLSSVRIFWPLR